MQKLGTYTANMGGLTDLTELFLGEAAKYFLLLLFAVLAVRLWRRLPKAAADNRRAGLLLACLATLLACAVGYFSIVHSLGRLYLHYGMNAFRAGNLQPAFSLFKKSADYWNSADALGNCGVCLLLSGKADEGLKLIDTAKTLRKGRNSSFEAFYTGVFYFFQDKPKSAIPFLETSSTDPAYTWTVTKLFATAYLDNGQPQDAARLMKPFASVEVAEPDHAFIAAALDLFEGNRSGAAALVNQFGKDDLPPFWKSRFDKLRAKIQNQNP